MVSLPVAVAEAVKDWINAGTYSADIAATRDYSPVRSMEALESDAAPSVVVSPRSQVVAMETRSNDVFTVEVDVFVQRRVQPDDTASIDVVADFVDEIVDRLRGKSFADLNATYTLIEIDPIFDARLLREESRFITVIRATYQIRNERAN